MGVSNRSGVPNRDGPSGSNRRRLCFLGLLALLAGLIGLALAFGLADPALTAANLAPVAPNPQDPISEPGEPTPWAFLAITAGGVLILGLGLGWLNGQFPKPVPRNPFRIPTDPAAGTTVIDRAAVEEVVAEEIGRIPDVVRCSVATRGVADEPIIEARVTINERADVQALLSAIETGPLADVATSLDGTTVDVRIYLDVSSATRSLDRVTLPI